ncbi:hypothetical protein [uncultured Tateyamaria sp.]|uniref:hypothetical protein n=1 Tax=uncultured Tateyamaria sp. TaxID=455651 RepID=UPI0026335963|nr:hypothetical protein [uncultured Tateyamaria sp.]
MGIPLEWVPDPVPGFFELSFRMSQVDCLNCDMGRFACDAECHFCVLLYADAASRDAFILENVPVVF